MKRYLRLAVTVLFVLSTCLALAQEAATKPDFDQKTKKAVLTEMQEVLTKVAFVPGVDFAKWPELVTKYQDKLDESKSPEEFAFVINTALQQFGFSHILLFSPVAAERRATNRMVGIGVRIEVEEKGIRVIKVYENGAASKAGLRIGDLIIEADGKPVRQPADLAGEEGQKVNVKVDRSGIVIERELVRTPFEIQLPEELAWPEKETALVTIPSFDATYSDAKVQELMSQVDPAKNLIIDLRGNGGGRVINLLHFSSFLLTRDQALGTFVDRSALNRYKEETKDEDPSVFKIAEWNSAKVRPLRRTKEPFKGEIAVLVDGGTGSASEMIAAALKEQRGAKIIGTPSAGAVLASTMRVLDHGFLLQFPLMDYVTIKGVRLEGNGLVPDIVAPSPRFGEEDTAIKEALRIFKNAQASRLAA